MTGPDGVLMPANARDEHGRYIYIPPQELAAPPQQQHLPSNYPPQPPHHSSPYGAPVGVPSVADRHINGMNLDGVEDRERDAPISREADATGEAVGAGPPIREDANGDRRVLSSTSSDTFKAESEQQDPSRGGGGGGFTALNQ